jgi:hypothetical protein
MLLHMAPTWPWMGARIPSGLHCLHLCLCHSSFLVDALQASALDPAGPVTVTVDLGGHKHLRDLEIAWEFPAKSFSVGVTLDGVKWSEVFATDSNILSSTRIALGSMSATKLRVVMHEARWLVSVLSCLLLLFVFQRQVRLFRGRLCMGYRRCLWGHTDCKALWPIAQQQAKAATPVTNILKAMLGSSRHARAKHCEVSFQLWRLALTSGRMHCNVFCVFGKQAARASVASVVSALAGALPKMQSCHGAPAAAAAAFLKSEGAVHAEWDGMGI